MPKRVVNVPANFTVTIPPDVPDDEAVNWAWESMHIELSRRFDPLPLVESWSIEEPGEVGYE